MRRVRYGIVTDGMGVWQEYRTPFYETTQFIGVLVGLPLLILLGVLLRLCFNWPGYKSLAGAEKTRAGISTASGVQYPLLHSGGRRRQRRAHA